MLQGEWVLPTESNHLVDPEKDFPYNQFDYCILTQTIQAVQKPDVLLNTLKKVGKNIIGGDNPTYFIADIKDLPALKDNTLFIDKPFNLASLERNIKMILATKEK